LLKVVKGGGTGGASSALLPPSIEVPILGDLAMGGGGKEEQAKALGLKKKKNA